MHNLMKTNIVNQLMAIVDTGIHGGFSAILHYLYVFQKKSIRFNFWNLLIAFILGIGCANFVSFSIADDFSVRLLFITFNKSSIIWISGFMSKSLLDFADGEGKKIIGNIIEKKISNIQK